MSSLLKKSAGKEGRTKAFLPL